MSKLFTLFAALTGLFVLSLAGPADAAQRKADGINKANVGQYEVSDQRRYRYRRYYRPYYGPRYYGNPGFGFSFRF